jgi:sugar transferase EpsL
MSIKNAFNRLAAVVALILLSPVILALSVAVWVMLGSPVFFCQQRIGLGGKPFQLIKFRTMNNKRDSCGRLLPDAQRITPFGCWLRRSSLDELPELVNIILGDMIFVGPRPLLPEYLPLYSSTQARRHNVKPGLTGWAQINGRNAISWDEKFRYDVWYVDNHGPWLDLKILLLTISAVIRKEGIGSSENVTMPRFTGSSVDQ